MAVLTETLRCGATLAFGYGGLPLLARPILRSRDQTAARRLCIEHMARSRRLAGVSVDVSGRENIPDRGGYVLVYNQTSLVDDLGNTEVHWRHADRVVVAAEYGHLPLARRIACKLGVVLLRRGDRASTTHALHELTDALRRGGSVSMGAEGRLSPDGTVGHFKRGAFLIAIRAGAAVVPVAVHGGRDILPPGSLRMKPGTLRYRIGPPVGTDGLVEGDAPDLAEHARGLVEQLYGDAADLAPGD